MTLEEAGAYIRLLSICWLEGALPDDPVKCARMVSATPQKMRAMWPAVRECFALSEDGRLVHPRLEREREKQRLFIAKQTKNGRRGGRPPKPNDNPRETQTLPKYEAKKSSPVSNLQDGSTEQNHQEAPPPAVVGGTTSTRAHAAHEPGFCDFCCLPTAFVEEQASAAVSRSALLAWAQAVREAWAGQVLDRARYWQFWKDRYREAVITLTPTAREQADYATLRRSIGPGRYGETIPTLEQFVARRRQSADGQPVTPRLADYLEMTIPA